MKSYSLYLFDLDGTVYRGRQVIPHAGSVITELIRRGAKVRYFTNNSAARPSQVSAILNHMGVPSKPEWIFSTAQLATELCLKRGFQHIAVVGEEALKQTFLESGIQVSGENPKAVVVGICRNLTYEMIGQAADFIRNGSEFIATNTDATYPLENGKFQPGSGAIVAAIQVASGVEPLVLGKPKPELAWMAMNSAGVSAAETLVIGDRSDTDIACGLAAGCDTYLVLTGVETELPEGQIGGADLRGLLAT